MASLSGIKPHKSGGWVKLYSLVEIWEGRRWAGVSFWTPSFLSHHDWPATFSASSFQKKTRMNRKQLGKECKEKDKIFRNWLPSNLSRDWTETASPKSWHYLPKMTQHLEKFVRLGMNQGVCGLQTCPRKSSHDRQPPAFIKWKLLAAREAVSCVGNSK